MDNLIKRLLWLYFFLLVGEGALRKWIVPGLSDPILIIRDPVVLIIYALALMNGRFPFRTSVFVLTVMAIGSIAFATIADTPPLVAIYGLRINYLHLPLIFIMGDLLDREDLLAFGRATLWLTLPIGLLMLIQYRSAPDSWINVGAGGEAGAQLRGALGRIRPPGPFSFITGPVLWFSLATAYTFHSWIHRGLSSRWLLVPVTCMIIIAIPISISRMLMLSVLLVVAFGAFTLLHYPRRALAVFMPLLLVIIVYAAIGGGEMTNAFAKRWERSTASGLTDSIFYRYLDQYLGGMDQIADAPLFGHGIGMGSNVGARFTTGRMGFQLAESEWAKVILELGPLLGGAFILYRCWLTASLLLSTLRALFTSHDSLPWLLAGASILPIISGQWAPPTILGFAVFGAGLTLAAARSTPTAIEAVVPEFDDPPGINTNDDPGQLTVSEYHPQRE